MKTQHWYDAVVKCEQQGKAYVLATVMGAAGSVPRDQGSKMVITDSDQYDTLGGGHLEYKVVQHAQALLAEQASGNYVEHFPLGASLGQCCGGSVSVLFESFAVKGLNLTVFGAGHVAKALMAILSQLPGKVRWVDSREEMFAGHQYPSIENIHTSEPVDIIKTLPTNSQVLVLTHNHQLDFELIEHALKRNDFSFVGCIGSDTKAQRFQMRLAHKGFSEDHITNMICPVGDVSIPGKLPMEVAVSISAQLIKHLEQFKPTQNKRQGVSWQNIKQELLPEKAKASVPNKVE
ncbi:MAG: xanthine dehydrogenase accessory protein XdhC [Bermanella sp.]